jgi:hypothetical protein
MVRFLGTNREIKICALWTCGCRNGEVVGFVSSVVELWFSARKRGSGDCELANYFVYGV